MASSTLTLHIVKGPKEGEILTRKPGAQIRVGRVVKGNNFTIKDPAISQKHITILFDPESSKWVVEDMDTSNGTIVNAVKIKPSVQIPLSDGDVIKIGETTSISVKIEVDGEVENNNLRRGRSKAQNNPKGLRKDDNLEVFVDEVEKPNPRRAGLRSRGGSKLAETVVPAVDNSLALQKNAKRGRTKKAESQTMVSAEINGETVDNLAKVQEKEVQSTVEEVNEVVEDSDVKHKNQKVGRKRKAPNAKQGPAKVLKSTNIENERACAKTDENEGGLKENVEALVMDTVGLKENVEALVMDTAAEKENVEALVMDSVAEKENVQEKGSVKQNEHIAVKKNTEEETENEIDFEKMTLEEWFDSLEKYLPIAISEAAEARIAELKEKARRFEEYTENGVEGIL